MEENLNLLKLLKKYTSINVEFLDTFLSKFKIGPDSLFHIKDYKIAKYLGIELSKLQKKLRNSKSNEYIENVDYIKVKNNNSNTINYMVNYQCFLKLAMSENTEISDAIRTYHSQLRLFIMENMVLIKQSLDKKKEMKKYNSFKTVYLFAVNENHNDILKIGETREIINRLKTYNIGKSSDLKIEYLTLIKNSKLIRNFIKLKLKNVEILNKNKVFKYKEIFEVKPKHIKLIIDKYLCDNKKEKNKELYRELSGLIGLYGCIENKKTIHPYIIINIK